MKIPKKVKIGAHEYKVICEKDLASNHGALAQSRHAKGVIVIDPDVTATQLKDSLIHEILHCINYQVKFVSSDADEEEAAVVRLTSILLMVIKENKQLFI